MTMLPRAAAIVAAVAGALLLAASSDADAASAQAPAWQISSEAVPTNFSPGGTGEYLLHRPEHRDPVPLMARRDSRRPSPAGCRATAAGERFFEEAGGVPGSSYWSCSGTTVVTCMNNPENLPSLRPDPELTSGHEGAFAPIIAIEVTVSPGASACTPTARASSAGGAAELSAASRPGSEPPRRPSASSSSNSCH